MLKNCLEKSLLKKAPFRISIILCLAVLTFVCFVFSLFMPFIEVKNFWIFTNTVSLVSSLVTLYGSGDYLLLAIVFIATFVIPVLKLFIIIYTGIFCSANHAPYALSLIRSLGKWSMIDVFAVAIMVVAVKLGSILTVKIKLGVLLFAVTVILSNVLVQYLYSLFPADQESTAQPKAKKQIGK